MATKPDRAEKPEALRPAGVGRTQSRGSGQSKYRSKRTAELLAQNQSRNRLLEF